MFETLSWAGAVFVKATITAELTPKSVWIEPRSVISKARLIKRKQTRYQHIASQFLLVYISGLCSHPFQRESPPAKTSTPPPPPPPPPHQTPTPPPPPLSPPPPHTHRLCCYYRYCFLLNHLQLKQVRPPPPPLPEHKTLTDRLDSGLTIKPIRSFCELKLVNLKHWHTSRIVISLSF